PTPPHFPTRPSSDLDGEAEDDAAPDRPAPARCERERNPARHYELAVREVDEPQHPEDEPDPDGHQCVDRALRGRVRDRLPVDGHPKYAATSRSVSSASRGPSVSRSSPFASTWERSASATVRCARCSTSRTARPRSRIAASA